ncbi:hypothetical protein K443DRAFT_16168 [Laccaria amethystina LaAM-08-1]|uniref:Uncharacterized protein n=1 Tax=Laccaria amethystina LaAM-08-1 TaxID=1095629 RepID=A0A0C9WKF8_9AGAR|nr:hypothetical protein K443DRAFT_16168 [Laccaria amethystina LaAM-08-1]
MLHDIDVLELYKQGFVEKVKSVMTPFRVLADRFQQGLMLLWKSEATTSAVPQKILNELDAREGVESKSLVACILCK